MTGTQHDQRAQSPPVPDAVHADDVPLDDDTADELPAQLDVPIDKPVEDVIESLQSAGSLDDDYEPHD